MQKLHLWTVQNLGAGEHHNGAVAVGVGIPFLQDESNEMAVEAVDDSFGTDQKLQEGSATLLAVAWSLDTQSIHVSADQNEDDDGRTVEDIFLGC